MSNSVGNLFKVSLWGESHGKAIGCLVDGCPPKIRITKEDFEKEMRRRAPAQSKITTQRFEPDDLEILSGIYENHTTGFPISLMIFNKNYSLKDRSIFRPGHADYTYFEKYGMLDKYAHSSARITAGVVAAGVLARKLLGEIEIIAYVKKIKNAESEINPTIVLFDDVESSIVRCPDKKAEKKMISAIEKAMKEKDSVGGVIECVIRNVPVGLGEPYFNKISADLGKAVLSINACRGFEIGSGFASSEMMGSESNDEFTSQKGKTTLRTNNSGGILGGISTGQPIIFRAAFKPTPTIGKMQRTVDLNSNETLIEGAGFNDPCVLPRAVPVVEAMAAIILADHILMHKVYSR